MNDSKRFSKKPLSMAIGATLGATFCASLISAPVANASENPFSVTPLSSGYMVAKEGTCGEATCGEGKCGEGKCGGGAGAKIKGKGLHVHGAGEKIVNGICGEGKCGEGKCGEGKGEHVHKNKKAMEGGCGA